MSTLLRPVYHYLIKTDVDDMMACFTNRVLPSTSTHSDSAMIIRSAAGVGNGQQVWRDISNTARVWNPRSVFKYDQHNRHPTYLQCRKTLPLYDWILVKRLEGTSLAHTNLMTALHDSHTSQLNKGFAEAGTLFDKIINSTQKIVNLLEKPTLL